MSQYFRRVLSRRLHTSRPHARGDLVGPPDPLSNLRPVVYGGLPESAPSATRFYSEAELRGKQHDPHEFSLNFARAQLDALNHAYWADVRPHVLFSSHQTSFLTCLARVITGLNTLRKHFYVIITLPVSITCRRKSGAKSKSEFCPDSTRVGSHRRRRGIEPTQKNG